MPRQQTAQSSGDDIENDLNLSMTIKMAKYGYCLIGIALKVEAGWTPVDTFHGLTPHTRPPLYLSQGFLAIL